MTTQTEGLRILNGIYDHLIHALHVVHRHGQGCVDCQALRRCDVGARLRFKEQETRDAYSAELRAVGIG